MIGIEKLNNKNTDEFRKLVDEGKNKTPYRLDFYKYYENQYFLVRYLTKKFVKLIKYNDRYIGYIWTDVPTSKSTRISDMFFKEEYINLINERLPAIFNSSLVLYEGYNNSYNRYLINSMKMSKIRITSIMKLNINEFNLHNSIDSNITFKLFHLGNDEALRCKIQNDIFNENTRVPLKLEDIKYDIKQEYFLKDLCVFIKLRKKEIGYGQIIFNRGVHFIVNFGIIDGYRHEGYGRELLIKLITMAKEAGIKDLYIRVENNNYNAKNLYSSVGFRDVGEFSSWIWSKDLI